MESRVDYRHATNISTSRRNGRRGRQCALKMKKLLLIKSDRKVLRNLYVQDSIRSFGTNIFFAIKDFIYAFIIQSGGGVNV